MNHQKTNRFCLSGKNYISFLLVFTLLTCHSLTAQDLKSLIDNARFGAKGGFNIADMIAIPSHQVDAKITGNIGIFANTSLNEKINFQPELVLSTQGGIQHTFITTTDYEYISNEKITYVLLPFMVQYNISDILSVEAGPQVNFRLASKYTYQIVDNGAVIYEEVNHTEQHRKFLILGFNIGAKYKINDILSAGLRYNIDISSLNVDQSTVKLKNSVLQLSVCYTLFDTNGIKKIFE